MNEIMKLITICKNNLPYKRKSKIGISSSLK